MSVVLEREELEIIKNALKIGKDCHKRFYFGSSGGIDEALAILEKHGENPCWKCGGIGTIKEEHGRYTLDCFCKNGGQKCS
jgi:hypothetical protein